MKVALDLVLLSALMVVLLRRKGDGLGLMLMGRGPGCWFSAARMKWIGGSGKRFNDRFVGFSFRCTGYSPR